MEIRCEPENRRSRAIPERLGFREEGTLREVQRIGDRRTDLVVYGMLAPEWNARRGG
jgi:ribosomal-protein-serine acetyltransferase